MDRRNLSPTVRRLVAEPPRMRREPRAAEPLPRVLVVEDNDLERMLIRHRLRLDRVILVEAADGTSAIELALLGRARPDPARPRPARLLGLDVIHQLKEDPATRSIPVIFVSAYGSTDDKVRWLDPGRSTSSPSRSRPGRAAGWLRVAFRLKFQQDLLEKQVDLDALTGLANRLAMRERLDAEWSACRRWGTPLSILILDVDHFKRINDRFGHAAGATRPCAAWPRPCGPWRGRATWSWGSAARSSSLVAPDCDLTGALEGTSGRGSKSRRCG